jgi:hypothetical protein
MAPRDRRVVQHDRKAHIEGRAPKLEGRSCCYITQHCDRGVDQLGAAGRLVVLHDHASDPNDGLLTKAVDYTAGMLVGGDNLREAGPVAQHKERDGGVPPSPVHPPFKHNRLVAMVQQLSSQRTGHLQPPREPSREVWAIG